MTRAAAGDLRERVAVLELTSTADKSAYTWSEARRIWADAVLDTRSNLFSSVGIGARGVTFTVRASSLLSLANAFLWRGHHCFLTSIIPLEGQRCYMEVKAALCEPVTLTAKPQARTGRDELNRPTAVDIPFFTFPGVLTEKYRANEAEDVYRVTTLRRVLVTPKAIQLRPGDLVEAEGETPYIIRQALDLDPWKNEYELERMEDA